MSSITNQVGTASDLFNAWSDWDNGSDLYYLTLVAVGGIELAKESSPAGPKIERVNFISTVLDVTINVEGVKFRLPSLNRVEWRIVDLRDQN